MCHSLGSYVVERQSRNPVPQRTPSVVLDGGSFHRSVGCKQR